MSKEVILYRNVSVICSEDSMAGTSILNIRYVPKIQTKELYNEFFVFFGQYLDARISQNKKIAIVINILNAHEDNYTNFRNIIERIHKYIKNSNSVVCAVFLCYSTSIRLMINSIASIYSSSNIPFRVFNNEEDGETYLYEQILNQ